MITWKTKVFGDNRVNFYGWMCCSLLVMGLSVCIVLMAIHADALRSPVCLLLAAIYLIVLGHFGIALQNYCARAARAIETEDAKKKEQKNGTVAA